jgi:hypothetical protein
MTSAKVKEMKDSLQHEFLAIFELCQLVSLEIFMIVLPQSTIFTV